MAHAAEIAAPPPGGEDLCEPFDAPLCHCGPSPCSELEGRDDDGLSPGTHLSH
jgi:hypothetical protein